MQLTIGLALLATFFAATLVTRAARRASHERDEPLDGLDKSLSYSATLNPSAAFPQGEKSVAIISPDGRSSLDTAPVKIVVRVENQANGFRAFLNRREITGRFARISNTACLFTVCELAAEVFPGDGLARGRNELLVEFSRSGQARQSTSQIFIVQGPKANAGQDQKLKAGQAVQLDGSKSLSTLPLTHRWVLTRKPQGSIAAISNPSSAKSSFVPDVNGAYVAQLIVHDGHFESEPDTVNISAALPSTLIPVETFHSESGKYGIKVGDNFYSQSEQLAGTGVQILVLDRKTLEYVNFQAFPGGSNPAAAIGAFLNAVDNTRIVIISSAVAGTGFAVSGIARSLESLGGTNEFRGINDAGFTFSFIGIKGLTQGQAYQVGGGSHNGYFAQDSQSNYAFIQTDYVVFEITPSKDVNTPSAIKIGGNQTFTSAPAPGALGGFLLVVVDRATLQPIFSDTYHTFMNTDSSSEEDRLATQLQQYVDIENVLVFLTTYGSPHNGYTPNFADIARYATNLGGTYEALYNLNAGDTYSLVSAANAPGVSSQLPKAVYARESGSKITPNQPAGLLRGVLGRGRRGNWYRPLTSDHSGVANLDFYRIIAQAPTPFPALSGAGEQQAYSYISQQLTLGPDFRTAYTDSNKDLDNLNTQLLNLADAGGERCTTTVDRCVTTAVGKNGPTAFCTVKAQLLTEMEYISDVRQYGGNLTELWDSQQSNISLTLGAVSQRVKDNIRPDSGSTTLSIVESTIGTLLSVGRAVPGEAAPVFGVASAVFSFGTGLANSLNGDSTTDGVNTKVGELQQQAADSFAQQKVVQGVLFDSITQDWGKLQALGLALCNTNDPNWRWDGQTTTGQVLDRLDVALELSFYQSLLPIAYEVRVWNTGGSGFNDLSQFIGQHNTVVFPDWPAEGYIVSPSWRVDSIFGGSANDFLILSGHGNKGFFSGTYSAPSVKILQHLFGTNGLGVYKPQFYRRWPFGRRWCSPILGGGDDPNCDYNSPRIPQ